MPMLMPLRPEISLEAVEQLTDSDDQYLRASSTYLQQLLCGTYAPGNAIFDQDRLDTRAQTGRAGT